MLKRALIGYLPVNIVQALAGFGSIFLFTRVLSAADYGVYALSFSVTSLVQTVLFVWIEGSMARFYPAEAEGEGRNNLFATLYRTYLAMVCILPLVAGAILILLPVDPVLKTAVGIGLGSILTRSLLKLAQERRRAAGDVRGFATFDMLQTGGRLPDRRGAGGDGRRRRCADGGCWHSGGGPAFRRPALRTEAGACG